MDDFRLTIEIAQLVGQRLGEMRFPSAPTKFLGRPAIFLS
jgi:hypothetical protein